MSTQPSLGTGFSGMLNQIGSFAFIYSGLAGIMVGILLIWAPVKSGQIENIDKNSDNCRMAKSQLQKEGLITKELPKDDKFESAK